MAFLEILFPKDISYSSKGGPGYNTSIAVAWSGEESRNQNWSLPQHLYDAAYGIKTQDRLENLVSFFHVVAGKANGFLYWDPVDYKSCVTTATPAATDQNIGIGTGALSTFQLKKNYTQSGNTRTRNILKPLAGTVRVAVAGVEKTITTHWTIDVTSGIITFTGGNLPANGAIVTAGYEFYVPVRFDVDQISISIDDYQMGGTSVPLIELKRGI